jgi:hypothetical protein
MKRIIILFSFALLILSCEKVKIVPNPEIPNWLQDRIAHDEEIIKSSPQSGLDIAAWIRYYYDGNYYFEYLNLLSSAGPPTYNYEGTQIIFNQDTYLAYKSNRCCKYYIWKGSSYFEIDD